MKLRVVGMFGAMGLLGAIFGTPVAAADDYLGLTYADASSAASDAGQTVVVASRVGDKVDEDDCLVARSQPAPFTSAIDGSAVEGTVQFYLNCNAGVASATTPGNSLASEQGRFTRFNQLQQEAEEQAAADQSELDELAEAGQSPGVPGDLPSE